MNVKKFLIVILVFGMLKICHAAAVPSLVAPSIQWPLAKSSSLSVYPCLSCSQFDSNADLADLQEGVVVRVMF